MSKKITRLGWQKILEAAADFVRRYDTSVTLRQCFYLLVAAQILPNTTSAYKGLSEKSAKARREGWFPELIDRTRSIHEQETFNGPGDALDQLVRWYRRDRTEGPTRHLGHGACYSIDCAGPLLTRRLRRTLKRRERQRLLRDLRRGLYF